MLKNKGSSFAVCTVPIPPCVSKFAQDHYTMTKRDMKDEIIELNRRIRELNSSGGQCMQVHRAPLFHTFGLTSKPKPGMSGPRRILETMPSHALHDWRERRPSEKLHLNDSTRLRMGRAAIRYFQAIYGMIE